MSWTHACFIDGAARLYCWGTNTHGELGAGLAPTMDERDHEPQLVGEGFVAVSAGVWATAAIDSSGRLWGWGRQASGWLEDGTQNDATRPVRIGADSDWIDVMVGSGVACGIHADETAECWGRGDFGESRFEPLGPGEPRHLVAGEGFVQAVGGSWYTQYLRRTDGTWLRVNHASRDIVFEEGLAEATAVLAPGVGDLYFVDAHEQAWVLRYDGSYRRVELHDGAELLAAGYVSVSVMGERARYLSEDRMVSADVPLPEPVVEIRVGGRRGCARLESDQVWCFDPSTDSPLTIRTERVVFPE
jgi:hypothetical protein